MKFGKTFVTHQIPEWSVYYMNYKHLKKRIKTIDLVVNEDELVPSEIPELIGSILAEFFFELDRDIEKVDEFYTKQFREYDRRLQKIILVLGYSPETQEINHKIKSSDELDEVVSILLELRTIYRNLKWYGELNHKGFVKILKKLDKKLSYLNTLSNEHQLNGEATYKEEARQINIPMNHKDAYLSTRVNALPFANETELINGLSVINAILNNLGAEKLTNDGRNNNIKNPTTSNYLKVGDTNYSIDQESLERFYSLIADDDSELLVKELDKIEPTERNLKHLISLLNRATMKCSYNCIEEVFKAIANFVEESESLSLVNCLFDKDDISGRNFFHHHTISLGKKQKIQEAKRSQINIEKLNEIQELELQKIQDRNSLLVTPGEYSDNNRLYGNNGGPDGAELPSVDSHGIAYLLNNIVLKSDLYKKELGPLLNAKDNYLRTPLHYAAQYGLKDLSKTLLDFLNTLNIIVEAKSIDDLDFWGDQEGLTPIHLSIIGKHPLTTEILVKCSFTNQLTCSNLLLLAVRLDSPDILDILINHGKINVNYTDVEHNMETALYIASKLNLIDVVKFLLTANADTNIGEDVFGWTPVFAAASEGYGDIVKVLIEAGCTIDCVDESGWLPMEHATLRGHLDVADLLIPDDETLLAYDMNDSSKNTPRVKMSEAVKEKSPSPSISSTDGEGSRIYGQKAGNFSTSSIDKLPEPNKNAVNEVYRQLKQLDTSSEKSGPRIARSKSPLNKRKIKPVKSFGHKYLDRDESLILITLGTTDLRDSSEPIELNKISMAKTFFTELDTALSLVITIRDKSSIGNNKPLEPPVVIDLPLEDHHGSASDPISFKLKDGLNPQDTIITFDVVPTYQYANPTDLNSPIPQFKKVLGRAVAIMSNAYTRVGANLRSLNNNITVPIIESGTLDVLGSIKFEYMYVNSFEHASMNIGRSDTYWKQLVSTRVIGHRGLGKNVSNRNSLQLGENTVESFIAAASLGASYVEFDVQLTKDSVPVIYHDFLVAESGVDIPMHVLTAEQFLGLSEDSNDRLKSMKKNLNSLKEKQVGEKKDSNFIFKKNYSLDDEMLSKLHRPRSMSHTGTPDLNKKRDKVFDVISETHSDEEDEIEREFKDQINRRMKLTKTWKDKGFKGNARGLSVASNFVTLSELFKKLPKTVGFNIELKYPMLDEAEEESTGEIAIDLNYYVDTILKCVYDENTTGRDIIFSSFHPDVCLLLSMKQPTIPILFLTEAGTQFMADIRASSLQNAIRFAKKWNLLGIVSAAKTLVKTPRLAQVVKSSGLVCVTYGVENNSYELAKIQMKAGVDAVIADSVLAVREGLRKDQEQTKEESFE